MGGCRCYYRNCKVNSYNIPGMHFFRFPTKDKTRCDLWVAYTHQNNFYQLPPARQRNIQICGRHFRDECFMNYKKDRLVSTAVPSIHRFSKDKALDYEQEIFNGVPVTLPEAVKSHLKAPAGFECPLGFDLYPEKCERLSVENEMNANHDEEVTESSTNSLISTDGTEVVKAIEEPADLQGIKRSANCLLTEETATHERNEAKRSRTNNPTLDDSSSNTDDAIVIAETSSTNSQPTIINHQIMDAESRLWQQSKTFSLQEGVGYQLMEIQSQSEQSETEQIQEIADQLVEGDDEENLSLTEDLHLSHKLEAAYIEIDGLRSLLMKKMEKVKTLESKLSASRMACKRFEQHVATLKDEITGLTNANEHLKIKYREAEILKVHMEDDKEERTKLESDLLESNLQCSHTKKQIVALNELIAKFQNENEDLKKNIQNRQMPTEKETMLRQEYGQQLQSQELKHLQTEQHLQQQIAILEQSLKLVGQQLTQAKNNLSSLKTECACIKSDRLNSVQKVLALESQLQKMQELYDVKNDEHTKLENSYESLQKSNEKLISDYKMLECNQHQVSTVTTSNSNRTVSLAVPPHQQPAAVSGVTSLTKLQLFNGIKRYISSSMCSLLRMEMFGSSEREWKPDERQVAVDLLRLGEFVYKYLTDEWRFRLPALRDVHNWLSQSIAVDDDEDI